MILFRGVKPGRFCFSVGLVLSGIFISNPSHALDDFNFDTSSLSNLTTQASKDLLKTVSLGADHRAYTSASPLGVALGLEFGLDLTIISVPAEFITAMALVGNTTAIPSTLPLPKLQLRKGLPFGFDFGFSYVGIRDNKILGMDIQWAFMNEKDRPNMAARLSYTNTKLWFVKTTTFAIDVLASKKLAIFDPYVGLGFTLGSGELEFPSGSVPVSVDVSQSFSSARFFVGLPLDLLFFKIVPEYNYSFSGISTYGVKAVFSL